MESVASSSSSTPPNHHTQRPRTRLKPTQPCFADRIVRALHHHLQLLHRRDSNFFVLGATGNVYTVALCATPSCTCPDRATPCKHILFVFLRLLGLPLDDLCLRRRTLRPCQVNSLLGLPTLPEALAGASIRQLFHKLFFKQGSSTLSSTRTSHHVEIEEGRSCPVCLDEMGKEERIVACGTCRNPIHEECLMKWKRSSGRRSVYCVICRARWKDINRVSEQDKYLNLVAYATSNNDKGVCGADQSMSIM